MQKVEFRTPNRMKFESEFKSFNNEADLITTGNVWGRVQHSSFISKDWPLEKAFPRRYLDFLPDFIRIEATNRTNAGEKLILYCLKLNFKPVAWILTDDKHNLITCARAGLHQYAKETSVLNEALKYLTN